MCDRLRPEVAACAGLALGVHVRLPLPALAADGTVPGANVDFVVWERGYRDGWPVWTVRRLVEAKGRPAREWCRTRAALEASYGVGVEVMTKKEVSSWGRETTGTGGASSASPG